MSSLQDTIKSLENIKKKYIIEKLEHFSEQLAETTAKTAATTTSETAATTTPKKKDTPQEEVKTLPVGDAKKFEKNIMDSLKWVFIGIGLFVLLLFILGIVYWLMSGNSEEKNLNTVEEGIDNKIQQNPSEPLAPALAVPLIASTTSKNPNVINDDKNESIFSFMSSFSKKDDALVPIKNEELNKSIIPESSSSSSTSSSSSSPSSTSSSSSSSSSSPPSSSSSSPSSSSSSPPSSSSSYSSIMPESSSSSLTSTSSFSSSSSYPSSPASPLSPLPALPNISTPQNDKNESIFSSILPFSKKEDAPVPIKNEELNELNKSIIPKSSLSSLSSLSSISKNNEKIDYIGNKDEFEKNNRY